MLSFLYLGHPGMSLLFACDLAPVHVCGEAVAGIKIHPPECHITLYRAYAARPHHNKH